MLVDDEAGFLEAGLIPFCVSTELPSISIIVGSDCLSGLALLVYCFQSVCLLHLRSDLRSAIILSGYLVSLVPSRFLKIISRINLIDNIAVISIVIFILLIAYKC